MTKFVLLHRADSIYDDRPDVQYDFPKMYKSRMEQAVGDWIIYYEPVKAGPMGYFAVAKIDRIIPNPTAKDRYLALIQPGSYTPFDREIPRLVDGRPLESLLMEKDGTPKRGGAVQLAVRPLPEGEFERIVNMGLPADLEEQEERQYSPARELAEPIAPFHRPVLERLTRRPYRDVLFRRKVRQAYHYRCAISGLNLRNGGGRPEVQAAHIRPVHQRGSDSVRNGLALSATLHWMFDRGLVSVADDNRTILVSRNKVPDEVVSRLISPGQTLLLPKDPRKAPHPDNLRWHRENIFGQIDTEETFPWKGAPSS